MPRALRVALRFSPLKMNLSGEFPTQLGQDDEIRKLREPTPLLSSW